MGNHVDGVSVVAFSRLMKHFLEGRISAMRYTRSYFKLMPMRMIIPNGEVDQVTQQAYGDADDYEPDESLRQQNPRWIDENELREKVRRSLRELEDLGFGPSQS